MTDMILETQSLARMLLNFLGPLPEQINTMNMIYTLYYNPADWNTLKNKPPVIAAGNTQAEARDAIDVPSNGDLMLVATALAERLPPYTGASKIKVSAGSSPFTPVEIDMMATAVANSIAQRTTTGAMKVATGLNNDEAITLAQFNERIPAYTGSGRVMISSASPPYTPTEIVVSQSAVSNTLMQRGGSGQATFAPTTQFRSTGAIIQQVRDYDLENQPAHTAKSADGTLTAAELLTKIIVVDTTTEVINLTLPLASDMETALAAIYGTLSVGDAFRFKIINTASSGSFGSQVVTNTGWTIIGSTDIGNWFYGEFIARRTAANTFTLYRA